MCTLPSFSEVFILMSGIHVKSVTNTLSYHYFTCMYCICVSPKAAITSITVPTPTSTVPASIVPASTVPTSTVPLSTVN